MLLICIFRTVSFTSQKEGRMLAVRGHVYRLSFQLKIEFNKQTYRYNIPISLLVTVNLMQCYLNIALLVT